jgi:cysteine desulfurase
MGPSEKDMKDMQEMVNLPIYFDHHATTPVDPRVLEAMMPYFSKVFGNPASKNNSFGQDAHRVVEDSRDVIGKAINARSQDVVFTSGATEGINLAIKGVHFANRNKKNHFITVATEHQAVLASMKWVESEGVKITYLPVDGLGIVNPEDVARAIRPDTVLVSVMAANNEVGVIQPLKEIGAICREREVFFMTDAAQALCKIPLDVQDMNIDLLACSAHKVYGPKGVGALYCRRSLPRVSIQPIIDGGGQERGLRSGTLNVPGIVGFARAVAISLRDMGKEQKRLKKLRDKLFSLLKGALPDIKLNGHPKKRLAGNLNIYIPGVESEALIIALADEIVLSSGSACTTASIEPSHVLMALGLSINEVHSSIRIGLGRMNTDREVVFSADLIAREVIRVRSLHGDGLRVVNTNHEIPN